MSFCLAGSNGNGPMGREWGKRLADGEWHGE